MICFATGSLTAETVDFINEENNFFINWFQTEHFFDEPSNAKYSHMDKYKKIKILLLGLSKPAGEQITRSNAVKFGINFSCYCMGKKCFSSPWRPIE
jgi:hypothetical protein